MFVVVSFDVQIFSRTKFCYIIFKSLRGSDFAEPTATENLNIWACYFCAPRIFLKNFQVITYLHNFRQNFQFSVSAQIFAKNDTPENLNVQDMKMKIKNERIFIKEDTNMC